MNYNYYIRKLAKSTPIQNQFIASKELFGVKLFANEYDFSKIQQDFLTYVYFYYNLFQDIYTNQVSKKVTDNDIYEDAYSYYKANKKEKPENKTTGKRTLEGSFSKDNKIIFPNVEE